MGIEPTSQAWEARILPMYYTRKYLCLLSDNRVRGIRVFKPIYRCDKAILKAFKGLKSVST